MVRGDLGRLVVEKIKNPLRKLLIITSKRLPELTKENLLHPNSHILMKIKADFLVRDKSEGGRHEMFDAALKLLIAEYEHDPYYRDRFDWFLNEIKKSNWKPWVESRQMRCWSKQ